MKLVTFSIPFIFEGVCLIRTGYRRISKQKAISHPYSGTLFKKNYPVFKSDIYTMEAPRPATSYSKSFRVLIIAFLSYTSQSYGRRKFWTQFHREWNFRQASLLTKLHTAKSIEIAASIAEEIGAVTKIRRWTNRQKQ